MYSTTTSSKIFQVKSDSPGQNNSWIVRYQIGEKKLRKNGEQKKANEKKRSLSEQELLPTKISACISSSL